MSLRMEIETLRRHLEQLAGEADADLSRRYALRPLPTERPSLYRRVRTFFGRVLRRLGLKKPAAPELWLAGLEHVAESEGAEPLVIWALGVDRDALHAACRGFEKLHAELPGFAPVLVTDVADFAFFARLGWLVEYVPALSAPAQAYAQRKERYLAWRYRDALTLPAAVGLRESVRIEEILE
jgi:hypothetical protein